MTILPFHLSPEVANAKHTGAPLVALESTIITHGMPYPQNLETAWMVEDEVRDAGAIPATIAVLNGALQIGLDEGQLETLAKSRDVAKLSRADLAVCMAQGRTGATTVAATMIAAHAADIATFATGGIGGVHKGAEDTFDISADLQELAQTPVTVVCAGAKAILDLPKTLEVLETLGVPVIAHGQDTLPAFWSASSDLVAPLRMDSAEDIARAHLLRAALNIPGGQLVTNPIPAEHQIAQAEIAPIIAQATQDAAAKHITGKLVTPFVLSRIFDLTQGRSLKANIALVANNARLAAKIAISHSKLAQDPGFK